MGIPRTLVSLVYDCLLAESAERVPESNQITQKCHRPFGNNRQFPLPNQTTMATKWRLQLKIEHIIIVYIRSHPEKNTTSYQPMKIQETNIRTELPENTGI